MGSDDLVDLLPMGSVVYVNMDISSSERASDKTMMKLDRKRDDEQFCTYVVDAYGIDEVKCVYYLLF